MEKKKSNILVIIILCILLTVCIGYIVYDKTNENKKTSNNNENVAYDLDKAKELVDKYYVAGDKFGIDNAYLAYNQLKITDITYQGCSMIYETNDKASRTEDPDIDAWIIEDGEFLGVCDEVAMVVDYEKLNYEYNKLFKKELPKKNVEIQLQHSPFLMHYNEKGNQFVELDCRCGGDSPYRYLYDVISAEIKNDKLIVEVGILEYMKNDNVYEFLIDNNKQTYTDQEFNSEDFSRKLLNKYKDSTTKKYTFTFNMGSEGYYLEKLLEQK